MGDGCSYLEPWKVREDGGDVLIIDAIAGLVSDSVDIANAERIVACVNAMRGVRDPSRAIIRFKRLGEL